jgi:hypothetical protein
VTVPMGTLRGGGSQHVKQNQPPKIVMPARRVPLRRVSV